MKELFYKPNVVNKKDEHIVFWSDTHFGHRCEAWAIPLWKQRGFDSVDEHDSELISRWNAKSSFESTFFFLGDFMFGLNSFERFESTVNALHFGTLYMMPGNHQTGWKQHFSKTHGNVWELNESKHIVFVPNYLEVVANGKSVVLCHYPIASFNQQGKGAWHLHGHCHGNLHKSKLGELVYQTRTKDIGVETQPNPVNLKDVREMMKGIEPKTYDHHDPTT